MHCFARLLTLLALCAASSLTACKDAHSSPPTEGSAPVAPVADAPVADAPVTDAPVADAPVEAPAAGDEGAGGAPAVEPDAGAKVVCTPDTRKGGICTREYRPVCGSLAGASRTFSNKCVACSDEKVASYVEGPCPGTPAG